MRTLTACPRHALMWPALLIVLLVTTTGVPAPQPAYAAGQALLEPCGRVDDLEASVKAALETRIAAFRARRAAVLERQAARWSDENARRGSDLDAARQRLADRLATLTPETESQRQAIADFRAAVSAALDARHAAIEAAIRQYRASVVDAIDAVLTETLELFAAHRDAIEALVARARAECAAGSPIRTVLETLQAGIRAARAELDAALAERLSLHARLQPLQESLRSALREAHAAFRAAVEEAATALKAAFASR